MNRKLALDVLGLSAPIQTGALRRAYLRAVRSHPPEHDPEGFARVRAAYELLLNAAPDLVNDGVDVRDLTTTPLTDPDPDHEPSHAASEGAGIGFDSSRWEQIHLDKADDASLIELAGQIRSQLMRPPEVAMLLPPVDVILTLFFRLVAAGSESTPLLQTLQDALAREAYRLSDISTTAAGQLRLAVELDACAGKLDEGLRQALATGVLTCGFERAAALSRQLHARTGRRFRKTFVQNAPSFYAAVWPLTRIDAYREASIELVLTLLFAAFMGLRVLWNHEERNEQSRERDNELVAQLLRARVDAAIQDKQCGKLEQLWPEFERAHPRGTNELVDRALQVCPHLSPKLRKSPESR